jgi:hypothetical protein
MEAGAELQQIADRQPDEQRQGRNHLEIDDRRSRTTPTRRMSPILAMPTATVAKIISGTTDRMSMIKPSLIGFMSTASFGKTAPSRIPTPMAISTFT